MHVFEGLSAYLRKCDLAEAVASVFVCHCVTFGTRPSRQTANILGDSLRCIAPPTAAVATLTINNLAGGWTAPVGRQRRLSSSVRSQLPLFLSALQGTEENPVADG